MRNSTLSAMRLSRRQALARSGAVFAFALLPAPAFAQSGDSDEFNFEHDWPFAENWDRDEIRAAIGARSSPAVGYAEEPSTAIDASDAILRLVFLRQCVANYTANLTKKMHQKHPTFFPLFQNVDPGGTSGSGNPYYYITLMGPGAGLSGRSAKEFEYYLIRLRYVDMANRQASVSPHIDDDGSRVLQYDQDRAMPDARYFSRMTAPDAPERKFFVVNSLMLQLDACSRFGVSNLELDN